MPSPVRVVLVETTTQTETLPHSMPEVAPHEPFESTSVASAETSGSAFRRLTAYAGGMATKAAVKVQGAINYVQEKGAQVVVRPALAILAVGSLAAALALQKPKDADADTAMTVHHVIHGSWFLHPGSMTDTPHIHSAVSDYMPEGTEFDVQCVTSSDATTPDGYLAPDGNGDTAWEYGVDAATGNSGFVSDQGLDTQVTQGHEIELRLQYAQTR